MLGYVLLQSGQSASILFIFDMCLKPLTKFHRAHIKRGGEPHEHGCYLFTCCLALRGHSNCKTIHLSIYYPQTPACTSVTHLEGKKLSPSRKFMLIPGLELTFWLFLLTQGPGKRDWFHSWEFRTWFLGEL